MKRFKVILRPEPEGGFTFLVPSLPGCISYGESLEEARKNGKEAVKAYLECLKSHKECCNEDTNCLIEEIEVQDE